MRYFHLLNLQHIFLYFFPTLVFMILLGVALDYTHFRSDRNPDEIFARYPEDISDRDAPFPLVLILTIAGTVIWGLAYILGYGLLEANI